MPGRSLTPLEVPGAAASELLPRQDSLADELRFLLHSAVFTLSDGYVPPWRYQIDGNRADLYVDFERTWQGTDPAGREMTVACGAALSYLDAVALRRGRAVAIAPYPDPATPDLVARVRLEPGAAAGRPRPAGRERLVWDTAPAPPVAVVRDALEAAVAGTNVWLHLEQDPDQCATVAGLIAESDAQHLRDPLRRRAETAHQGPNRWRLPPQPPAGRLEPFVIHPAAGRRAAAARLEPGATGRPVFAVLSTAGDSRHEWLQAGQALGRLLMQARRDRIVPAFRNQLIRIPVLRARLQELIGRDGFPQVLLGLVSAARHPGGSW